MILSLLEVTLYMFVVVRLIALRAELELVRIHLCRIQMMAQPMCIMIQSRSPPWELVGHSILLKVAIPQDNLSICT